jgi:hypothetical protein
MTLIEIKNNMKIFNIAELNELSEYINSLKIVSAKAELFVGQDVWVVQKTKRTAGVVKKINKTRCLVDMNGLYNVPMSMLEPK